MGYTPAQVDEMSLWQFAACVDGYNAAHSSEDAPPDPMAPDEFDALLEANAEWIALASVAVH